MTILELEPYITGKKVIESDKIPYRVDYDLFNRIYKKVQESSTANINLQGNEIAKDFYEVEPDIKHLVPTEAREEIFYCLKNGFATKEVPAKCIYLITKSYNMFKIPNLICRCIADNTLETFFKANYMMDNLTIADVISNFCVKDFTPISEYKPIIKGRDFAEIYIEKTDMVAAIPNSIANLLSYEDVKSIDVDNYGLKLGKTYLKFMGGYYGASHSVYDLRDII